MILVVDKIEEEYVVCEKKSKKIINLKKNLFSFNVKEGDVVRVNMGKIEKDIDKTNILKKKIEDIVENLWE